MKHFIFALIFFFGQVSFGQSFVEKQNDTNPSFFKNGGFENLLTGWTVAAGTRTYPTTAGDKISGQGFKLAFTSINGTLLSQTYGSCADLAAKNLLTGINIKTPSSAIEVCSVKDGTDQQCIAVPAGGSTLQWVPATLVGGGTTCGMRVKTTSSTTSDITVDSARFEENRGAGNVFVPEPWTAFTPVSSWTTNTTHTGLKRCVDPYNVEIQYKASLTGAPNAGIDINYDVPAGIIVDTSKLLMVTTSNFVDVGSTTVRDISGSTAYYGRSLYVSAPNKFAANYMSDSASPTIINPAVSQAAPMSFASGDSVVLSIKVPTLSCGHMMNVVSPNNSADLMGTVFYEESGTCPANSIKVDGATLNATTHAALIARRTAKGIASPTVLPNLSGLFIRSAGTQTQGGVAHTAGALGAFQADQMQGHKHGIRVPGTAGAANLWGFQFWSGSRATSLGATSGPGEDAINTPITDGTNGTPRTGTTTRPANMAFTPCMWFVSNPAPLIASSVTYSNTVRADGVNGTNTVVDNSGTVAATNISNLDATPTVTYTYDRIGNTVSVAMVFSADATAAAAWSLRVPMPVTSAFTATTDAIGNCVAQSNTGYANIGAVASTSSVSVSGVTSSTASQLVNCTLKYRVK